MLSIEDVKKILKDKNLSDKEAEEIRDGCRNLAEIIFESYQEKKNNSELKGG